MTTVANAARQSVSWSDGVLRDPITGGPLVCDTLHSMHCGGVRYPVVDDIPFLRIGRDALCEESLRLLDAGDEESALVLLLSDRDDWARGDGPKEEDLRLLVRSRRHSLRTAMDLLAYGPVTHYFALRWSDPTYLSGLKLLEMGLPVHAAEVLEVACGIGHYLREMSERGIMVTGVDVVFSKLWIARHWVAPGARLICGDAAVELPVGDASTDAVFCHDAFYFLPRKLTLASEMRRTVRKAGTILIGHAHNRNAENFSSGEPWSVEEYAALFPDAAFYDDALLTDAFLKSIEPAAKSADDLHNVPALSMVWQQVCDARFSNGLGRNFYQPRLSYPLRLNPLLLNDNGNVLREPEWPSERYAAEYGPLSGYLRMTEEEQQAVQDAGTVLAPCELTPALRALAQRRIYLQLPERW